MKNEIAVVEEVRTYNFKTNTPYIPKINYIISVYSKLTKIKLAQYGQFNNYEEINQFIKERHIELE